MTYQLSLPGSPVEAKGTTAIELTLSSAQTISVNDIIAFDTLRASGPYELSLNSSTGEITLSGSKTYWIQASIDVNRSSTTSSFRFAWIDQAGTEISAANGGFDATWEYHSVGTTAPAPNPTTVASYVSSNPVQSIRLKTMAVQPASTANTHLSVIIFEVTP
jgi:hypothetical protein